VTSFISIERLTSTHTVEPVILYIQVIGCVVKIQCFIHEENVFVVSVSTLKLILWHFKLHPQMIIIITVTWDYLFEYNSITNSDYDFLNPGIYMFVCVCVCACVYVCVCVWYHSKLLYSKTQVIIWIPPWTGEPLSEGAYPISFRSFVLNADIPAYELSRFMSACNSILLDDLILWDDFLIDFSLYSYLGGMPVIYLYMFSMLHSHFAEGSWCYSMEWHITRR